MLITSLPTLAVGSDMIYVIVNNEAKLPELNQKQVISLFLGRARNFPNGRAAKPFDHETGSSIRELFFETLTGKQISDIDAYWARLSYSGRAFPPKVLNSAQDIMDEVKRNKNAISYVKGVSKEALSQQGIVVVYSIKGS
tara:strand:- start:1604 stop:2023 length:420 start_codon:yes stop_codon:yes gene_type:complete